MSFIGEREIKEVVEVADKPGFVEITLEDDQKSVMNADLFALIENQEKGNGTITDVVTDYFARKMVAELAQYDLDFYSTGLIARSIETLAHNAREQLFANTFGCTSAYDISLRTIVSAVAQIIPVAPVVDETIVAPAEETIVAPTQA